jgi:presenilin-like A22 family membrane protease
MVKIKKINTLVHELLLFALTFGLGIFVALRLLSFYQAEAVPFREINIVDLILGFVIYQIIFGLVLFAGLNIFFSAFLDVFLSLALVVLLMIWRFKRPSVLSHNLTMILSLAGIGGSLGISFSPWAIVFLLVLLSIYDYIAVYKTKHMVKMAKEMISKEVILGLIVPDNLAALKHHTKEARPGLGFMFLGGGDVACFTLAFSGFGGG